MRVVVSSISCDFCETTFEFDVDEDQDPLEAAEKAGWIGVRTADRDYDFCGAECLCRWFS